MLSSLGGTADIKRGTHLFSSLYGGRNAYVSSISNGGMIKMIFAETKAWSSISESIVRGPQWLIGSKPAADEESLVALEHLADENIRLARQKTLREQQLLAVRAAGKDIYDLVYDKISFHPKGAMVAFFSQDRSDSQTDYVGATHSKPWLIGLSKHNRNIFSEMRKSAENAQKAISSHESLNSFRIAMGNLSMDDKSFEHRENYSRGGGMFLSGRRSGSRWIIEKWDISGDYRSNSLYEALGNGMLIVGEKNLSSSLGTDDRKSIVRGIDGILKEYELDDELKTFLDANHLRHKLDLGLIRPHGNDLEILSGIWDQKGPSDASEQPLRGDDNEEDSQAMGA